MINHINIIIIVVICFSTILIVNDIIIVFVFILNFIIINHILSMFVRYVSAFLQYVLKTYAQGIGENPRLSANCPLGRGYGRKN